MCSPEGACAPVQARVDACAWDYSRPEQEWRTFWYQGVYPVLMRVHPSLGKRKPYALMRAWQRSYLNRLAEQGPQPSA